MITTKENIKPGIGIPVCVPESMKIHIFTLEREIEDDFINDEELLLYKGKL